jgi:hypothetical protein
MGELKQDFLIIHYFGKISREIKGLAQAKGFLFILKLV